jgi:ADP-heptose:LPS heptosyltransferase
MAMARMRWVDHWVGLPLCFLLGLAVTLARRVGLRRSRSIRGDRTLAVFKFFGLGSIIEATPLLRAIRQRYPRARLAFVTFGGHKALVRGLDLCTDVRTIRTRSPLHFALDVLRELSWLRRQRVEAVVDLEFFSKFSTLLAFFSGARVRVGFHLNDFWRYSLVTHPVYFNYYRHITDVYQQVAQQVDADIADRRLSCVDAGQEARQSAEQFLQRHGWAADKRLLGVNVNAGSLSLERRWPLTRFAELVATLLESHANLLIVLTGTRDERAYVLSLVKRLPAGLRERAIVAAGEWSFEEFIAALPRFAGFVTNDSGPMHLAAAVGVPVVSLWGPGRPDFFAPRVPNHETIYSDFPCSPCLYMFTAFEGMWCRHQAWCMQAIEPQTVREAVESMLAESSC